MSSYPGLSVNPKNACNPAQSANTSQPQGISSPATESHHQRRAGGSGSYGAGSSTRSASSAAKNNQLLRKQHRGHRRPVLANEDAEDEAAAMHSTGSRKGRTSITHLMNFSLPPRPQYSHNHHSNRNIRKNPSWGLGSGYHAADKARYIHANYRFVVSPEGDYRAQVRDADVHLDWNNVLQILVSAQSQSTNCPICLSTPIVPRMAKCGHLFCMSCLIRYMHSEDSNPVPEKKARWKKCPICWDSIYVSETRPVRWFVGQEAEPPQEGGDVVLRLLMRQPKSTLAIPRDSADALDSGVEIPWYFVAEVMDYARVVKGSQDYMTQQYDKEIEELLELEKVDELMFGDDTQWTRKAVASVNEAKEKLRSLGNPPIMTNNPHERRGRKALAGHHDSTMTYTETSRVEASCPSSEPNMPHTANPPRICNVSASNAPDSTATRPLSQPSLQSRDPSSVTQQSPTDAPYFFYEALLHYYLSPLDIRILKAAFGDYASFPSTILPRVEHISTGHIVDDELRRRAKYLAHLPHGCEVNFLECNWTDVVPSVVLDSFASEIERRRKKNREKDAREEKERLKAEKAEDDLRWAAARRKRPVFSESQPTESDFQPLPEPRIVDSGVESTTPPWSSARLAGGSGFASLASPSTSPATAKTVWGTRIAAPASPILNAEANETEVSGNDGWLQDWERDLLREEDLIAQMEQLSTEAGPSNNGASNISSKKKKGKKITLMTTNARRGA